ncbi:pseudouridine synthase [Corticibacter populi]|uniref:Pseudouridine synthase n=1 Tax=Corticibacter populi TaxID=1550736 RepID=A0A3M6QZ90_9BURK|nr:16S rRNA pseudouridine(516) synthase [Corticibacter populi]RMX08275.1 pseudouridine synthase [Corticibacter populi]RZS35554.1 ribosomal small subunit pseudouridine synthase A [Corticibacter populi]
MILADILFSQGFGTRRVCAGLAQAGLVQVQVQVCGDGLPDEEAWHTETDPAAFMAEPQGLWLRVQGQVWPFRDKAWLMMNKPAGTECSQKPSAWPSVYTLLPAPLRQRPVKGGKPGVQAIGRLDQDTTGLLLLSDDGIFIHRMSSPKHRVAKVYEARTADPVTPGQVRQLLAGVVLNDDPKPVKADACELKSPHHLVLTLHAGKYHQVKRMIAAVGNRVEQLHRSQIGGLVLPADLAPGQWRWLQPEELALLR